MRWNGVLTLGTGLAAIGFFGMIVAQIAGPSPQAAPRIMAILISVLACGALVACVGAFIGRRETSPSYRKSAKRRLFEGRLSKTGTRQRHFGQRAEYSALGKQAVRDAAREQAAPRLMLGFGDGKERF
jgi:hypothetical protein